MDDYSIKKHFGGCPHDCPDTCAMIYEVADNKLLSVKGNPDHPMTDGVLCVKLKDYEKRHYHPDRLLYPHKRVGKKGKKEAELTEPPHDPSWERAVESGVWSRPPDALPDAALWPTWGAYRERILTSVKEVSFIYSFKAKSICSCVSVILPFNAK